MTTGVRALLLPDSQRRTIEELTDDLDLRSGDARAKLTAFWLLLSLSAVIASAGILSDSTATVIGAMIIAPLGTPIMGIALAVARRGRSRSALFVLGGAVLVVGIGAGFSWILPGGYDLLANGQIAARVSPGFVDMIAALATGLAGAVAMARRDVATVLPGVAIAISLVPPLAVAGVCLGRGDPSLAFGAVWLFLSNLLALVLAGTLVFTALTYRVRPMSTSRRSRWRAYLVLSTSLTLVLLPLLANTVVNYVLATYAQTVDTAARRWLEDTPGATVTHVQSTGLTVVVSVRTSGDLPPSDELLAEVSNLPDFLGLVVESTQGERDVLREDSVG